MLTLTGCSGNGAVLGTAYLPDREVSGQGFCSGYSSLDSALPITDWKLPPPDGVWHSVSFSPYGPKYRTLEVGRIQSIDTGLESWNPCKHSTLRGDLLYRGYHDEYAPYWRKPASTYRTDFSAVTDVEKLPVPTRQFISALRGRPCTIADNYVRAYDGKLVRQNLTAANGGNRYYDVDTPLPGIIAPNDVLSALTLQGVPHAYNRWYCRRYDGTLVTNPIDRVHWYKTNWERPSRTTFVRDQLVEYHTTDSFIPVTSVGYTGYGNLAEANHRKTVFEITHVRSDSPGRFQVKYDQTTDLSWYGWKPYSSFSGSKVVKTTGLIASILILEPGLTADFAQEPYKCNLYCTHAEERARLLYDHRDAERARTLAVRDVRELDSNWLENLAGVKGTMDCINPLLDGYKAMENGDMALARKSLASAYLVYKYVIYPGIADAKNLSDDGSRILDLATRYRFSNERRRGAFAKTEVPVCETKAALSYFTTYHLKLKDEYFSQIWSALEKLGLDPSSGQLWDLVPFSFAGDWFVPVGESLRNIDAYNSLVINRDVLARIESFKVQWPVESELVQSLFDGNVCTTGGPVVYSWYDRRIYYDVGSIDPIAASDCNGLTLSQQAQGAALLTQMMR